MRFLLSDSSWAKDSVTTVKDLGGVVTGIMKNILGPVLLIIGSAAVLFAIYLGVMYAKAEDANKRKEVQGRLIGAVIGVVIIIVGVTLCYAINWETIVNTWIA
jgi:hypothetical protein